MADGLKMEQVQAAMKAMMDKAMEKPNEPVAMAIVDAAGNLEAYAKMDNLRIFSRRHAQRKASTSAVMGVDSGAHAARLHAGGRNIADLGADGVFGRDWQRRRWLSQRPGRRRPIPGGPERNEPLVGPAECSGLSL